MAKYRKKPVVIEAVNFDGKNFDEIKSFCTIAERFEVSWGYHIGIKTLEGYMEGRPGDWIIKGVNGEFYPCKPDIFEKTYEPVD
jgi:hypothetical protein